MNRHVPIAARLPGLRRLTTMRVASGYMDTEPQHYRIVEAWFADRRALDAARQTAEFAAMREDRQRLIDRYGVTNTAEMGEEVEAVVGGQN